MYQRCHSPVWSGYDSKQMNPVKKVIGWLRRPAVDSEAAAEAHRLHEDRETIKGSQTMVGFVGPGPGNVSPTPDVLHPKQER